MKAPALFILLLLVGSIAQPSLAEDANKTVAYRLQSGWDLDRAVSHHDASHPLVVDVKPEMAQELADDFYDNSDESRYLYHAKRAGKNTAFFAAIGLGVGGFLSLREHTQAQDMRRAPASPAILIGVSTLLGACAGLGYYALSLPVSGALLGLKAVVEAPANIFPWSFRKLYALKREQQKKSQQD
jgi:hypothetical protein